MNKVLEALEKINHTICLNNLNKTLEFGLDKYDGCDCKSFEEFVEAYNVLETTLINHEKMFKVFEKYNLDISDDVDLENWIKLAQFHYEKKSKLNKALEIIKSVDFSLEFDESQNEWVLYISNEKQYILVAKGTGVKTYDLLKEVLL